MKTKTLRTITLAVMIITFCACDKNEVINSSALKRHESTLTINLGNKALTKAIGAEHGNQLNDNFIQTLEFFIFHADGPNVGELDAYKKFTTADGISNLQIKATTGKKSIYAVANSHRADWKGIITLVEFKKVQANLKDDNVKNYIMTGSADATLQVTTSITFALSRLAAKIELQGVKTAFAGTPYEGFKLSNVKAFLINVHSSKRVYDGGADTPAILNNKALVAADANSCIMPGMLYDVITPAIDDAGYNTSHYLYAFENTLETETVDSRFTRLVIQADLNGKTYYYPINVNEIGYGYVSANGHYGIKRNTEYKINVTIMRPGSTNPDKPVEHGTLTVTLNILDWVTTPIANPEF
ncbi:MAG: fimbrial protein [Bacteroidales bacterium]